MKGFGKLIKNELIKLSHQTSFRVISVIVLIICILTPSVMIAANKLVSLLDGPNDAESAENEYREIANGFTDKDEDSYIAKYYYNTLADSYGFFRKNSIDGWKLEYFAAEHNTLAETIAGLELILKGYNTDDVAMYFSSLYNIVEYDSDGNAIISDPQSCLESSKNDLSSLEETIKSAKVSDVFENSILSASTYIKEFENEYESARKEYEASPTSEVYKYKLEYASVMLDSLKSVKEAYEFLSEHVDDYYDWRVTLMLSGLETTYLSLADSIPMDKDSFENSDYLSSMYDSYEDYVRYSNKQYKDGSKAVRLMEYAFYHNIPLPQIVKSSPKMIWQTSATSVMSYLGIMMVILAGMSVASEFSNGTIRLLLIRPRKRYKILLSKLSSLMIIMVIYMLTAYVITFAVSLVFGGVGDIITPDISEIGGKITEITPIVTTGARMLVCSITPMLLTMLAFAFAVLTKKTALAIAMPLLYSQMVSGVIFLVGTVLATFFPFIRYTPLLYTDMSIFNTYFLSGYIMSEDFSGMIMGIITQSMSSMTDAILTVGLAYNFAAIAILIVISFISFSRKEIK